MKKHNRPVGVFVPDRPPASFMVRFKTAAGKVRARAKMIEQGKDDEDNLVLYANKNDLVKIPVYTGFDSRFANQMRAKVRRDQRKADEITDQLAGDAF